ncbi:CBS domain-containing protein [Corallococcus macrosporus]|uniref:CBS domain-containing protein n=1 Tax=Corallococcus macrosporus TaxID=35 RepID=A0ABS3DG42_9BACT|nr:CBS domain-containing protein [Corallococcus macrosporus]MBN8230290.1 CBS domain-containing protein [Corallococcus macrosporus]
MGTKDYSNGNGRHDLGRADISTPPTDAMATHRSPDVAPPGSRERSESDVSGWNPGRDEEPSNRQGRFHRAAAWRLARVRTDVDDTGTWRADREGERDGGTSGPYGRDDRDPRYANGAGPVRTQGEGTAYEMPEQRASYREWDRTGYGGPEPLLRDRPQGRAASREDARMLERFTPQREERFPLDPRLRESRDAATASGTSRRWRREPLSARDIMTRPVRTARRDSTLREVAQLMRDEDCGVVPIVDADGRLLGLVTDRDLALRAFTGQRAVDGLRAADVMTEEVEAVLPEEDLHGVIELMGRKQVRRVPVVEPDDRLVGIIALGDIASRADQDEELQEALERISSRRSFWSRLR